MSKWIWPAIILVVLAAITFVGVRFFQVDATTYAQAEQTDAMTIDTSKPIEAPNGRRLQDLSKDKNDATFGSVLPYLAAPHQ